MNTLFQVKEQFLSDARRYMDDKTFGKFQRKGLFRQYYSIRHINGAEGYVNRRFE